MEEEKREGEREGEREGGKEGGRFEIKLHVESRPRQLSVFFHCLPSDYALPCLAFLCIYMYKI